VPGLLELIDRDDKPLQRFKDKDDSIRGIVMTQYGPMLIASRPVIPTNREGAIQGAIIMGRFLNQARLENLSERTHLQFEVSPAASARCLECVRDSGLVVRESGHQPIVVHTVDSDTLHGLTVVNDVTGTPAVVIRVSVLREITQQGRHAARTAMIGSVIGLLTMLFVSIVALQRRVIDPLQNMATHAVLVGETDNLDARLHIERSDEIGTLAHSFDCMVARLAESREKLQIVAHHAGMAEIASEVLHNVGNAINTANCCVELVEERLSSSRLSGLEMATLMLSEQAANAADFFRNDPRGPKLIHYLVSLNDTLQKERCENLEEARRLQETIRHIRDAIASQQDHARRSDFRQRVNLMEVLEESLLVNAPLRQQMGVRVEINASELPDVSLNKSRVVQVLVNLQKNAVLSMQTVPEDLRRMAITVTVLAKGTIEISVQDSGIGLTPEIKERLFAQRFTTRTDGSGLGLHYCANVVREMGGEITAESDGPGTGATFRFTIPRAVCPSTDVANGAASPSTAISPSIVIMRNDETDMVLSHREEQYV
jgi:signal transduction histidine kinase